MIITARAREHPPPLTMTNALVLIELYILPRIRGESPFFVERIWDLMYRDNRKPVAKGESIATMAASVPPFHGLTGEEA